MAMKVCYVVLIVTLLSSAHLGASAPDWVNDLTRNIEQQVQQFTTNLHSQIQASLQPALAEVNRAIENLPRDAQGRIISSGSIITNGNIVSINSENGMSRSIVSGHTPDGKPYVRTVTERNDGNYLYHNEITFFPKTNTTEKILWKLDLTNPNSKPEIITDEKISLSVVREHEPIIKCNIVTQK